MAKKDIKGMLGNKSPSALRHAVQQVDILKEATAALTPTEIAGDKVDQENQSMKEADKVDEKEDERNPVPSKATKKQSIKQDQETDRSKRSVSRRKPKVFSSKDVQAVLESDKRETERYSFEIYSDQKEDIQQVCDLYEQATGKKLSASRLIRDVLDTFLPDALKTFESSTKESDKE